MASCSPVSRSAFCCVSGAGLTRDRRTVAEAPQIVGDRAARRRIAVISMHTSPTASLGQNANGGLNVYVREVCTAFSDRGIATDIFTRSSRPMTPTSRAGPPIARDLPPGRPGPGQVLPLRPGARVCRADRGVRRARGISYDLLYSHYWLSGEVACLLRPELCNAAGRTSPTRSGWSRTAAWPRAPEPEPAVRIRVEGEIAQQADLLIASTQDEAEELVNALRGRPCRGFPGRGAWRRPRDVPAGRSSRGPAQDRLWRRAAPAVRRTPGAAEGRGVAIRALALLRDRQHEDVRLLILGEDSRDGDDSEKERLKRDRRRVGVRDRVDFIGSVAHHELPYFYAAAECCVMPSYSESFGLVALEAQACGCPVVASGVSGLRSVVRDEVSGYLIDGHDPAAYAERTGGCSPTRSSPSRWAGGAACWLSASRGRARPTGSPSYSKASSRAVRSGSRRASGTSRGTPAGSQRRQGRGTRAVGVHHPDLIRVDERELMAVGRRDGRRRPRRSGRRAGLSRRSARLAA